MIYSDHFLRRFFHGLDYRGCYRINYYYWFIATYNKFISLKNTIEEAFSTMDVYLKKRYDLVPNLVETVKGYAAHEKETLQGVISARNMAQNATTIDEKLAGENMLSSTLRSLFAVAESYPI